MKHGCLSIGKKKNVLRLGGWHIILLLILSMAGCVSSPHEQFSNLVIGVVDPQRVLKETVQGERLSDQLSAFMKDRQVLIELEQKELRELEESLRAQLSVLSPSARQVKEEQFRQKMGAYQQKVAELNREVQDKQRELQDEFRRKVETVVSEVAEKHNLGLVLEHGSQSGTLYYQQSWDISSEVIQALNQSGESLEAP